MTAKIAFGCRTPNSHGRHDAFIYMTNHLGHSTISIFQSNKEYIYMKSLKEACRDYKLRISCGWIPMTIEDLETTANIVINETTRTYVDCAPQRRSWLALLSLIVIPLVVNKIKKIRTRKS